MPLLGRLRRRLKELSGIEFDFSLRPKDPNELRARLRELEQQEIPGGLDPRSRRRYETDREIARIFLTRAIARAEYEQKKPWLAEARVFWGPVMLLIALLVWLVLRAAL